MRADARMGSGVHTGSVVTPYLALRTAVRFLTPVQSREPFERTLVVRDMAGQRFFLVVTVSPGAMVRPAGPLLAAARGVPVHDMPPLVCLVPLGQRFPFFTNV